MSSKQEQERLPAEEPRVQRLHQILLWPLRLMPEGPSPAAPRRPWERLLNTPGHPWREAMDEYSGEASRFHERHYREFITFLPYVQRFLYGGSRRDGDAGLKVLRRDDIAQLRLRTRADQRQILLDVVHVDLYFFDDVDVVLLNVELCGADLGLGEAQELLYRLGRAYPSGWDEQGQPMHTLAEAEWLDREQRVLARSNTTEKALFLGHVQTHRTPRLAAHWDFMLRPLACEQSDHAGLLTFRQIEYYRMPMMAWLALDAPERLQRSDWVRLGLVTGNAESGLGSLPFADEHLQAFERDYCFDRFWQPRGAAPHTRYLCSGHAMVVVGRADAEFYCCGERGVLAQFRHQHFLTFLIAHFQKAALLMFSDRLVEALRCLDVNDADSVRRFKRAIRSAFEGFLRFTHRYWFHAISDQAQTRSLHRMTAGHLDLETLYEEIKARITDMSAYLETDSIRRQANTVVRLTVVTIFGLVGTITTGFLGMNLLSEADAPLAERVLVFLLTLSVAIGLTIYTMVKSKRLSDFLDALSDERLSAWQKFKALLAVWH